MIGRFCKNNLLKILSALANSLVRALCTYVVDFITLQLPVMMEFFDRADLHVSFGFAVRLAKIMVYLLYVIHVESCGYYAFNRIHGLNASDWSIGNYDNNP